MGLHGLMIARIEKAFVLGSSTAARPSASAARSYSLYLKARQESPSSAGPPAPQCGPPVGRECCPRPPQCASARPAGCDPRAVAPHCAVEATWKFPGRVPTRVTRSISSLAPLPRIKLTENAPARSDGASRAECRVPSRAF